MCNLCAIPQTPHQPPFIGQIPEPFHNIDGELVMPDEFDAPLPPNEILAGNATPLNGGHHE